MSARLRLLGAILAFAGGLVASRAHAEPYLMVRSGSKCDGCHTNLTGGGKRTAFAHIHGKELLQSLDLLPIPAGVKAFNGEINSWVSIGADLRVRNTTVFQDPPDKRGRVENNTAFRRDVLSNDTDLNEFLAYLQVDLIPDMVTLYADENFTDGATNREAFGLIRSFLPWKAANAWNPYVKAGRLYPAFGLRVQDDQAFIRARSGFDFSNPDEGGEIGIGPGPFFLATSITNGDAGDKDVQATVNGYAVFEDVPVVRNVLAGASFARQSDKRHVTGVYVGSNLWRFTYLGEIDVIDDHVPASATRNDDYAAYAELNFLLFDWLNLRGTFDFVRIDGGRDRNRFAIGAEPFINKVLQPRIQYRVNNGPSDQPEQNQDELWVELHFFL